MKVQNFTSNNGNKIANQFIITTKKGRYFQSYNSIIAFIPNKQGARTQIGSDWTTQKQRVNIETNF